MEQPLGADRPGLNLQDLRAADNFALRTAYRYGQLPIVEYLMTQGLTSEDLQCQDHYALRTAAQNAQLDVVQELINHVHYTREKLSTDTSLSSDALDTLSFPDDILIKSAYKH